MDQARLDSIETQNEAVITSDENIYDILKQYDFKLDEEKRSNLTCGLCNKLLSNAVLTPAGCQFCRLCLERHMKQENSTCPKISEDCFGEVLNLERDVVTDYATNRRIFILKVECPIEKCTYNNKIRNMGTHLETCTSTAFKCIYWNIGCRYGSRESNDLEDHSKTQQEGHINFLVNKNAILEKDNASLLKDMKLLKDDTKIKEAEIDQMKIDLINEQNNNTENRVEIGKMKEANEKLAKELEQVNQLMNSLTFGENKFNWTIEKFSDQQSILSTDVFQFHYKYAIQLKFINDNTGDGQMALEITVVDTNSDLENKWDFLYEMNIGILNEKNGTYSKRVTHTIDTNEISMTEICEDEIEVNEGNSETKAGLYEYRDFEFTKYDLPYSAIEQDKLSIDCIIKFKVETEDV